MPIIMVAETVVIFLFICHIFFTVRSVKSLERQMKELSEEDTNVILRNETGQRLFDGLIRANNLLLGASRAKVAEAEKSLRNVKDGLAEIAHDLRTPLTAAGGYTGMLKSMELSDEERKRYLDIIEECQDMVRHMVDCLYYYARMETGLLQFKEERIEIRKILSSVLAVYYESFERKRETVRVEMEEKDMYVFGDGDAVLRIFSNIIANALSHGRGEYVISLTQKAGGFRFSVSNAVFGMAAQTAERTFETYDTKDSGGINEHAGLGLFIAKSLAETMGGTTDVACVNGRFGVVVWLPGIGENSDEI